MAGYRYIHNFINPFYHIKWITADKTSKNDIAEYWKKIKLWNDSHFDYFFGKNMSQSDLFLSDYQIFVYLLQKQSSTIVVEI